jgi:hypothetical protein
MILINELISNNHLPYSKHVSSQSICDPMILINELI